MAKETKAENPADGLSGSLFEGLEEADSLLLRRQIELTYMKDARGGHIFACLILGGILGAVAYLSGLGDLIYPAATRDCLELLTCSAARAEQVRSADNLGLGFVVLLGAIVGWIWGLIQTSTSSWRENEVSRMLEKENLSRLNQAVAVAKQRMDEVITHRKLTQDLRTP